MQSGRLNPTVEAIQLPFNKMEMLYCIEEVDQSGKLEPVDIGDPTLLCREMATWSSTLDMVGYFGLLAPRESKAQFVALQ